MQLHQRLAFKTIAAMRKAFDLATGYSPDHMNEARWLRRIIFLESVAGVPGMVSSKSKFAGPLCPCVVPIETGCSAGQ